MPLNNKIITLILIFITLGKSTYCYEESYELNFKAKKRCEIFKGVPKISRILTYKHETYKTSAFFEVDCNEFNKEVCTGIIIDLPRSSSNHLNWMSIRKISTNIKRLSHQRFKMVITDPPQKKGTYIILDLNKNIVTHINEINGDTYEGKCHD